MKPKDERAQAGARAGLRPAMALVSFNRLPTWVVIVGQVGRNGRIRAHSSTIPPVDARARFRYVAGDDAAIERRIRTTLEIHSTSLVSGCVVIDSNIAF